MRQSLIPIASLALLFSLSACADDVSTEGTDDVGDTTESDSGTDSGTESGSGTMDETTTDTTDSNDTGPTEINVSGEVTDFFTNEGIPAANVSVMDMPGFETVSDADGLYSIAGMPPSTEVFFLIDGNADTYWGGVRPASLPAMDIDDLQLGQVSNTLIDAQLMIVQQQDPNIAADEMASIIIVRLLQPTATGAVVDFQPPLPPNTFYGVDADNKPVLNGTGIDSGLLPFWVAFNVPPSDAGAYAIEVTHPERECTVLHPSFPTLPRYVTLVDVDCPPPP
ncbi:MAG: carboxypeptidase regulatory-like domain-containing protein [Myxococcales bacterium]|nr:carboxypeptidase regulatory-like domain-containing protein [Myxococcales bacterium]